LRHVLLQTSSDDTPLYAPATSYEALKKVLEDKLQEFNETNAVMDLVLFQQAMEHITRISRIIDLPR
jgi:dynein heavy chain